MLKQREWLLLIVGEGDEEEELARLAVACGVSDRVRFLGFRPDMESVYAASDIFVHAALMEPLGNVVLEALSCGLPCVVSPVAYIGASGELTDDVNALFANPRNPCDWAGKIDRLLGDRDFAARLGKEGRGLCERRPDWSACARTLLNAFGFGSSAAL
jgi:glycosyltransferase involved in cell wall biosynthesis